MKTNQILTRKLADFNVNQRTSDGMFNATELLKQWNQTVVNQGINLHTHNSGYVKKAKDLDDFFDNKNTKEFINALILEENLHGENSPYVKSKASRGANAGTWMHPVLFVKFAMWLNPRFEVKVIKFVYDELIKYRHEAGDAYILLSSSLGRIVNKSFLPIAIQKVSQAMNHIVFNNHETGIRNKEATEENLRHLYELEKKITDLIQEGFITNYEQLMKYLRNQWKNKYEPKVLKLEKQNHYEQSNAH